MKILSLLLLVLFILPSKANAETTRLQTDPVNFQMHEIMSESTFFLSGPWQDAPGGTYSGTVFALVHPFQGEDIKVSGWKGDLVLVTAKHVFENISGDYAVLQTRSLSPTGAWEPRQVKLRIRKESKPLFTSHPKFDVSAMWLIDGLAEGDEKKIQIEVPPPSFLLGSDADFEKCKLTIGSQLYCLGYPHGIWANKIGFPILRSGSIASYPILPTTNFPTFHFDFEVYPGNSGGPVYSFSPGFKSSGSGIVTMTQTASKIIVGLVSEQVVDQTIVVTDPATGKKSVFINPIKLGKIISSPVIKETLESLRTR